MALEPRHPLEPALHEQLRSALNRELRNKDFFVWIDVEPTGTGPEFAYEDLDRIVRKTEEWLATLNPDAIADPARPPELRFSNRVADVSVQAIPRKREVRDRRADEIVGNPLPILVGFE